MGYGDGYGCYGGHHSPVAFLNGIAIGTTVTIQFDGGGVAGVWTGRFEGFDGRGNALFSGLRSATTGFVMPGLTRLPLNRINSVSV